MSGKAIINIYIDSPLTGMDTHVYVYVKNDPADVGYRSISPMLILSEQVTSADNYSAMIGSRAPTGMDYARYSSDDNNRTFQSLFYK